MGYVVRLLSVSTSQSPVQTRTELFSPILQPSVVKYANKYVYETRTNKK